MFIAAYCLYYISGKECWLENSQCAFHPDSQDHHEVSCRTEKMNSKLESHEKYYPHDRWTAYSFKWICSTTNAEELQDDNKK